MRRLGFALGLCALVMLSACSPSSITSLGHGKNHAPTSTPRPLPTPTPKPVSWLKQTTLLTIYGRAFNDTPILGRLGFDRGFADMQAQIQPFLQAIRPNNRHHRVRVAIHLIYAIVNPCNGPADRCLGYLDDTGVNLVRDYIRPAAKRGWLVVLDDQLGRSWPAREVRRMIAKGYLKYDNVEVALDPEFRTAPDQETPGIPVGQVGAGELNRAQMLINKYASSQPLRHHKIMIVHQFQTDMILNRQSLRHTFANVDPVIIADGFGDPATKAQVYATLLGAGSGKEVVWRGIKLFYPNPLEQAGHFDDPVMDWRQVFGWAGAPDGAGNQYFLRPPPDVIVIG